MTAEQFLEYLQSQAGPALRVVSWYDADDCGDLYVRDDLDRQAVIERVSFLSERLQRGSGPIEGSPLEALGDEWATVQVRDKAIILRFPLGRTQGLLVSIDVEAARNLHGFVMGCYDRLEDVSGPFGSGAE